MDTQGQERRKEQRLLLSLNADVKPTNGSASSFRAMTEDMSLYGLRIRSQVPIEPQATVFISFPSPVLPENNKIEGVIKWCFNIGDSFVCGVELLGKNIISFPFENLVNLMSTKDSVGLDSFTYKTYNNNFFSQYVYDFFIHFIYSGFYIFICRDYLQKKFITLSYETDLSTFYFDQFLRIFEEIDYKDKNSIKKAFIFSTLNESNQVFNRFNKLLTCLDIDLKSSIPSNTLQTVNINQIIQRRINELKKKSSLIDLDFSKDIHFYYSKVPDFKTNLVDLMHGLDFLFLHSFQFLLFGEASFLHLETAFRNESISLIIKNDGPRMLKTSSITFTQRSTVWLDLYPVQDRNHLAWFQFIIPFFREHRGALQVQSEPGNNRITLTLQLLQA